MDPPKPFLIPLVRDAVVLMLDDLSLWILRNPDADERALRAAWAHLTDVDSEPLRSLARDALGRG